MCNRLDDKIAEPLTQFHVDIAVHAQITGQYIGHELVHSRGVGVNPDPALDPACILVDITAQMFKLAQHNTGMAYKSLARRSQGNTLAVAVKQSSTQEIGRAHV